MTLQEINALSILGCIDVIIQRVVDVSIVPVGESVYQLDPDTDLSDYERIRWNPKLFPPTESRLLQEFEEYKQELLDVEQARLDSIAALEAAAIAETNRVQDIKDRWEALRPLERECYDASNFGEHIPNLEADLFKKLILNNPSKENAETILAALEDEYPAVKEIADAKKAREELNQLSAIIKRRCELAETLIIGYNTAKMIAGEMSSADVDAAEVLFSDVLKYLQLKRPDKAKNAIVSANIENTVYTEDFRQELINILSGE